MQIGQQNLDDIRFTLEASILDLF